jgi:DNA-binding transcriptional MerR regulator
MDDQTLRPREVARILEIPPSTLRTYSARFAPLLSSGARGASDDASDGALSHRRYTPDDVAVLKQVKALLDAGLSYRGALAQLAGREVARPVNPDIPRSSSRRRPPSPPRPASPEPPPPKAEPAPVVAPASGPTTSPDQRPVPDPLLATIAAGLVEVAGELRDLAASVDAHQRRVEELRRELAEVADRLDGIEGELRSLYAVDQAPRGGLLARLLGRGREI